MKAAVILENSPDVELDRWEFEYADPDEVDDKVTDILNGVIFSVGDTIKIVPV